MILKEGVKMKSVEITEEMSCWNTKGKFIKEGKYRFHCYVEVEGTERLCYMPSNCKLEPLFSLAGREVLLKAYEGPSDKFEYVVEAVRYGNSLVLLNLQFLNRIVEEQLERRVFNYLGQRSKIRREVAVGTYKSDLYIEDTQTYIEVKALLNRNTRASYPMDTSVRNIEQLEKIYELLEQEQRLCYFLFSMNPKVKEIVIDSTSSFGIAIKRCVDKGLLLKAYAMGGSRTLEVKREIPVVME